MSLFGEKIDIKKNDNQFSDNTDFYLPWIRVFFSKVLNNTLIQGNFYQQQRKNPTSSFNKTIIQAIDNEIEQNNLPSNASKLIKNHPRNSRFYMLPKIHKANNPGRPIVSAVSCPSSHVASFFDSMLKPIIKQIPNIFEILLML